MKRTTQPYAHVALQLIARPVIAWAIYDGDMQAQPISADFRGREDSNVNLISRAFGQPDGRGRRVVAATPGHFQLFVIGLGSTESEHKRGAGVYLHDLGESTDWGTPVVAAQSIGDAFKHPDATELMEMYIWIAQERYPGATVAVAGGQL